MYYACAACTPEDEPEVYKGPAEVVVRALPERERVATLTPQDGRFGVLLEPGHYRVRANIEPPGAGSGRHIRVRAHRLTRVRLFIDSGIR